MRYSSRARPSVSEDSAYYDPHYDLKSSSTQSSYDEPAGCIGALLNCCADLGRKFDYDDSEYDYDRDSRNRYDHRTSRGYNTDGYHDNTTPPRGRGRRDRRGYESDSSYTSSSDMEDRKKKKKDKKKSKRDKGSSDRKSRDEKSSDKKSKKKSKKGSSDKEKTKSKSKNKMKSKSKSGEKIDQRDEKMSGRESKAESRDNHPKPEEIRILSNGHESHNQMSNPAVVVDNHLQPFDNPYRLQNQQRMNSGAPFMPAPQIKNNENGDLYNIHEHILHPQNLDNFHQFSSRHMMDGSQSFKPGVVENYDGYHSPYHHNGHHFQSQPPFEPQHHMYPQMSPQMMQPQMSPQMMETQMMETQMMETQMMQPQTMESQMMESQMMESQMMESQMMQPSNPHIHHHTIDQPQQRQGIDKPMVPLLIESGNDMSDTISAITMMKLESKRHTSRVSTRKVKIDPERVMQQSDIENMMVKKDDFLETKRKDTMHIPSERGMKISDSDNMVNKKDELLETIIPPGDMSIVLSSSPDGLMIEGLSETSVARGLLQIGDRIVGLDGIDISMFSAKIVAQLLHTRKHHGERSILYVPRGGVEQRTYSQKKNEYLHRQITNKIAEEYIKNGHE